MSRVVTAAREWIGTPYRHQHSVKGVGCDCLGLIRGVYRSCVGPEPVKPPSYSPSWGEADRREVLIEAAEKYLAKVDRKYPEPGDVIIFRMKRNAIAKHCGIMSYNGKMIHAYQGEDAVLEGFMGRYWRSRIAGIYEFPARVK